jgi:hypothetical protein
MPKILSTTLTIPRIDFKIKQKSNIKRIDPEVPRLGTGETWSKKVLTETRPSIHSKIEPKAFRKALAVTFVALDVILMLGYLMNINSHASSGYEIKKLQQAITAEQEQAKQLNIKLSEGNSILTMQSDLASQNFVPVTNPTFFENKQLTSR